MASFLESKPNITTTAAQEKLNTLEGLDITLSQLTLSGLNEIATKLDIPASQLSNMTLVQLTEYISNFIKNKSETAPVDSNSATQFADFKADFANFNNFNEEPHDKYAVFRELLQEEIKQTKIDTEPEEHLEERKKEEEKLNNLDVKPINETEEKTDRYAALREIVESEIKQTTIKEEESVEENNINEVEIKNEQNNLNEETTNEDTKIKNETNIIDTEKKLLSDKEKEIISPKDQVIEYSTTIETKKDSLSPAPLKSPSKIKSPVPGAVTEVIQTNNRLTSGSLSDVVSGSSPEVDNTGSTSEVAKKSADATGESWAIFDQPNLSQHPNRDKHSEEGVSPWSSDSKEFGNGSPPEWVQRPDSGSWTRHRREQDGWWDTSAEPEAQYYPSNRRSTDSYEDEGYEYYDRPPRRRRQMNWASHGSGGQATGGHSSSSRDASPWEEEPRRRELRDGRDMREHRETWSSRHSRGQHSFERQRDRRHADSWDEEDDYEYDEEHSGRYHWPERHSSRESEKERHGAGLRERDSERWADDWGEARRHRRRREIDRDRWCCPDWEQETSDQPPPGRYSMGRWRDRKHEERYYSRDSQESPWEDDYTNEPEETHSSRYLTAKRTWKRPSSASEMDRKTGETKSRQGQYYMGSGGSDGERDRRYKVGRRSRSRDSQFTESTTHGRHKIDPNLTLRGPHRSKPHMHQKSPIESEFAHDLPSKKLDSSKADLSNKRSATLGNRKKTKDSPKTEEAMHTFPRKSTMFENNFVPSETESPISAAVSPRFTFENDFETSEAESPIASKSIKGLRFESEQKRFESEQKRFESEQKRFESEQKRFESEQKRVKPSLRYDTRKTSFKDDTRISPSSRTTQKSPFEDDFSPPVEKAEVQIHENISTSSIKEEMDGNEEEEDSFGANNFDKSAMRKKMLSKNRLSNNFHIDTNLKKSESVNIFARESDPFDDEFFSGKNLGEIQNIDKSPRGSERKWTEDFEDYDFDGQK
ncbi:hypothetical protein ILUMI_05613 [Ignelater luminosus]|uniref:Uncharacterized protein n=1 Tax=Ignelater luminosus TaxID=2038154 RepID=A0A8K0GII1_IGNLU|nr:hypothetical protein ILUMI_05613 [Ignelater luminosus]